VLGGVTFDQVLVTGVTSDQEVETAGISLYFKSPAQLAVAVHEIDSRFISGVYAPRHAAVAFAVTLAAPANLGCETSWVEAVAVTLACASLTPLTLSIWDVAVAVTDAAASMTISAAPVAVAVAVTFAAPLMAKPASQDADAVAVTLAAASVLGLSWPYAPVP